jgi:hypothetical protein
MLCVLAHKGRVFMLCVATLRRVLVPLILLVIISTISTAASPVAQASATSPWRVLRDDGRELLLEVTTPIYTLHADQRGLRAEVAGLPSNRAPGAAALPLLTLPLAFAGSLPTVVVLEDDMVEVPFAGTFARAPLPEPVDLRDPAATLRPLTRQTPPPTHGLEPVAPVALGTPQGLRGRNVVQLAVAPLQVDWERNTLRHHRRLLISVRFATTGRGATLPAPDDALATLLDQVAINRQPIRPTPQFATPRAAARATTNPPATTGGSLKLLVERTGVQEVTAAQLRNGGWDLARLSPERLQLTRDGVEVPLEVSGQGDTLRLRFRGEPANTRYQAAQVYWLAQTTPGRLREQARPGPGTAVRWEENNFYSSQFGGPAGDGWFGRDLRLIDQSTRVMTAQLELPTSSPPGAQLAIGLQTLRDGPHALAVAASIAGMTQDLGSISWNDSYVAGITPPYTATLNLPTTLPAGPLLLTVTLTSPRASDNLYIDSISLPAVRLPEPVGLSPRIVSDTPSSLSSGAADYLIISHAAFLPALQPLVELQRARGWQVRVVDVQDVYDEWSYGRLDPEAIRAFVSHAYRAYKPAPRYLLLVGDGTSDFRGYLGLNDQTFVPPYLSRSDPWLGEIACDTCYGRVAGPNNAPVARVADDLLPDLQVGRLPVRSAQQAAAVVAKIVGYATQPPPGGWRAQHLFLADRAVDENGAPDGAGDFFAASEAAISHHAPGAIARRFYYDPAPRRGALPAGHYATTNALRSELLAAVDSGAATLTYIGHSNYWQWGSAATSDPPYLWSVYDADGRKNGGKLPILLSMTCLTGLFQEPTDPQLGTTDERLVTAATGGAIASLSPSGLGVATAHDIFYEGVIATLYGAGGASRTLGAAQLAGFVTLTSHTNCCRDLLYSYQLFGDPATQLPLTPRNGVWLPVMRR